MSLWLFSMVVYVPSFDKWHLLWSALGVLYLAKYAGCRHCYDLTYESCQESHKFDSLAQRMGLPNEKALKRALGW